MSIVIEYTFNERTDGEDAIIVHFPDTEVFDGDEYFHIDALADAQDVAQQARDEYRALGRDVPVVCSIR